MPDYYISVFVTKELYDYADTNYGDPYRARDRAATYIKHAIEDFSRHTVTILKADKTPDPPD